MPRGRQVHTKGLGDRAYPPATTPEGREQQLVAMAYDLVEQRFREGTASSQEIVHFLRMGSPKDRLERDIMRSQSRLYSAKAESYDTGKRLEALYSDAIIALKSYQGEDNGESENQNVQ